MYDVMEPFTNGYLWWQSYMELMGYNIMTVVSSEEFNLPVCQSDVQDPSGNVVSSCV